MSKLIPDLWFSRDVTLDLPHAPVVFTPAGQTGYKNLKSTLHLHCLPD
jgi:hypothetical protein